MYFLFKKMEYVKGNNIVIISVGLVFLYLAYKSNNPSVVKVNNPPTVSILKEKEKEKEVKKSPQKEREAPKKKEKEEDLPKKKEKEDSKKSPKKDDIPYLAKKSTND